MTQVQVPVLALLVGILSLPLILAAFLLFRAHLVSSPAGTIPEVIARILCSIGCMGKALDTAIAVYREEHRGLRMQGEMERRGRMERAMKTAVRGARRKRREAERAAAAAASAATTARAAMRARAGAGALAGLDSRGVLGRIQSMCAQLWRGVEEALQ